MSADPNNPGGGLLADADYCAERCVKHSFSFWEHLLSLIFWFVVVRCVRRGRSCGYE